MQQKPLVGIKCLAYNHEKTIRQCLDGFVKQKTDFPFIAVVHDDASTDHTADIIREFAEKYPDIIKPIFEEKNLYSTAPKGTITKIVEKVMADCKYVAICEGDDFWTSPDKLQRQISFMEQNPEYTMCCTDAAVLTEHGEEDWRISDNDIDLTLENLIRRGGLYFATAGIVYRQSVKYDYPECCLQCSVGDHPLQIMCGLKGRVRYFSDKMVAYRYAMGNSWSATRKNVDIDKLIGSWKTSITMLEGLDAYSDYQYSEYFKAGEISIILRNASTFPDKAEYILKEMLNLCPDSVKYADGKEKIKLFLIQHHMAFILVWIKKMKS
ncbi:glycosyltransferase [Ruminococcus sp. XPD3002]|uniref:glycosyltransferase family 2 protein n=1 Tax=Ruminococcus sp. XPD3002 TaxID=1452269 RepID=UPI000919076E|nr:Glycosyl transferase family 2 [Ruminococcus flavefaciens]